MQKFPRQHFTYEVKAEGTALFEAEESLVAAAIRIMPKGQAKWRVRSEATTNTVTTWSEDFSGANSIDWERSENIVVSDGKVQLAIDSSTGKFHPEGYVYFRPRELSVPIRSLKLIGAEYETPEHGGTGKVDIVWVIDISRSMRSSIENVRKNAERFIDELSKYDLDWRMGIVLYDHEAYLLPEYSLWLTSPEAVKSAFGAIQTEGSGIENMTQAIHAAHAEFFPMREDATRVIIALSDESDKDANGDVPVATQEEELGHLLSEGIKVYVGNSFSGASNHDIYWQQTGGSKFSLKSPNFGEELASIGADIAKSATKIVFEASSDGEIWAPLEDEPVVFDEGGATIWVRMRFESPSGTVTPSISYFEIELEHIPEVFEGIYEGKAEILWEDGVKRLATPVWKLAPPYSLITGQQHPSPNSPDVTYTIENLSSDPELKIEFADGSTVSQGGEVFIAMSYPVMVEAEVSGNVIPGDATPFPLPQHSYGDVVYEITDITGPPGSQAYFENASGVRSQRTDDSTASVVLFAGGEGGSIEPWSSEAVAFDGAVNGENGFAPYRFTLPTNLPGIPSPGTMLNGKRLLKIQSVRYRINLLSLTSEDGAQTDDVFRIYFADTQNTSSRTFLDGETAKVATKQIEAVSYYKLVESGDILDELPIEWSDYDDATDVFESGVGDLDDLVVSLGDTRPTSIAYQVVGRRFEDSGARLSYIPSQVTVSLWATGDRPWDNYRQSFEYEVVAYPQARFNLRIDGVATLPNGQEFTGSKEWSGLVVDAYTSPKALTSPILQEIILTNSEGKPIDLFLDQGEPTYSFTLTTSDTDAEVRFSDTGTNTTTSGDAFVEAIYTVSHASGRKNGSLTYPGMLQVANPIVADGDVRYQVLVHGNDEVVGVFVAPDGTVVSDDTSSASGAWADNPDYELRFYLASPYSGVTPWESARHQLTYRVNENGDYTPAQVIAPVSALGIPDNAINLKLHLSLEKGQTQDGVLITEHCGAHFMLTQAPESSIYSSREALEQAAPIIEVWSTHMGERYIQTLEEILLHEGSAYVAGDTETLVLQIPAPEGLWHSFVGRSTDPGYQFRIVRDDDQLLVYARALQRAGRWTPQVNKGVYYHGQIEYAKLNQPAIFTVRADTAKEVVSTGTVVVEGDIDGQRVDLASIVLQAPTDAGWIRPFKRPLEDVVHALDASKSAKHLGVRSFGLLQARLHEGYLEIAASPDDTVHGTIRQREGAAVLPVQMPMTGPVLVADANDRSRLLVRLDEWAKAGFEREIEQVGKGYPMLVMPIPYGKLIACYEDEADITDEVDLIGAALIRYDRPFTFGQVYRIRLRAINAFGVDGDSPDLRVLFSDNTPSMMVAAEQEGSPPATEPLTLPVPWTNPETHETWIQLWRPETEGVTLFPFDNPIDRGFIVVSNKKRKPHHIDCMATTKSLPSQAELPLQVICTVTDHKSNPVGGEVVQLQVSWSDLVWYERTDLYGHVSFLLPGPTEPGVHGITATCRSLTAQEEVIVH